MANHRSDTNITCAYNIVDIANKIVDTVKATTRVVFPDDFGVTAALGAAFDDDDAFLLDATFGMANRAFLTL